MFIGSILESTGRFTHYSARKIEIEPLRYLMNSSPTFFLCTYLLKLYLGLYSAFYLLTHAGPWKQALGRAATPVRGGTGASCFHSCSAQAAGWKRLTLEYSISGGCTFSTNFSLATQACWPWGPHIMDALCRQLSTGQEEASHLKTFLVSGQSSALGEQADSLFLLPPGRGPLLMFMAQQAGPSRQVAHQTHT